MVFVDKKQFQPRFIGPRPSPANVTRTAFFLPVPHPRFRCGLLNPSRPPLRVHALSRSPHKRFDRATALFCFIQTRCHGICGRSRHLDPPKFFPLSVPALFRLPLIDDFASRKNFPPDVARRLRAARPPSASSRFPPFPPVFYPLTRYAVAAKQVVGPPFLVSRIRYRYQPVTRFFFPTHPFLVFSRTPVFVGFTLFSEKTFLFAPSFSLIFFVF